MTITCSSLKYVGEVFSLRFDIKSFMVFHVFRESFLHVLNCFRKYVFFARRMLLLRIALYVDRFLRRISYCDELVFVILTCLYRLSLYLIDLMMPCVIQLFILCLYILNFTIFIAMNLLLALIISDQTICFKLLERLIYNRLLPVVDPQLPREQAGFRPGRSIVEQVVKLTEDIETAFENRKKCGAVFVDLSAAYDTVWHRGLTLKMLQLIPNKHMVRFIRELITNRSFKLYVGKDS